MRPRASGTYPSGTSGTKRARTSSLSRIRQGAPGVVCSPGSSPSRSQRRIVNGETPSSLAACWIVTRFDCRGPVVGRRGCRRVDAAALTRGSVNGRPVPVRRPWRERIAAIWRSGWCSARRRISSIVSSPVRRRSGPRALSLTRQLGCARRPPRRSRRRLGVARRGR